MRLKTHQSVGCIMAVWLMMPPLSPEPQAGSARPSSPGTARKRVRPQVLDGVTYADQQGALYVPAPAVANALGWGRVSSGRGLSLKGQPVLRSRTRWLLDGTPLVSVKALAERGAEVKWHRAPQAARLRYEGREVWVREGVKRIAINRARQRMRAWQGRLLVLDTRVSTGKVGHTTPTGAFTAGPFKAWMHRSRRYNDAPMPWTVQVLGDVCIHGSSSVPSRPASHGCIRVPMTGGNPSRWIYEWVDIGAPVVIKDRWPRVEGRTPSTASDSV